MNEFQTFLRTRRSVRRFKPDPIPAHVIERILKTTSYAPSAHNLQPWRFVMVLDATAKTNLAQALIHKMRIDMTAQGSTQAEIASREKRTLHRINEAPVIIMLCRDVTAIRKEEPEENIMAMQSVALAGLQLLLAAHAEGLGGNWICWPLYAQKEVRTVLELPTTWELQGMFFLGYTDEKPRKKKIKSLNELVLKI